MLKIRLKGRLGNQLFIYAFARELAYKYNQKVLVYDRKNEKDKMWYSHLDNYPLNNNIIFTSDKKKILAMNPIKKGLFLYDRLAIRRLSPREKHNFQIKNMPFFAKNGLFLLQDGYFELPENVKSDSFFDGYFQSPRFFENIKSELKKELIPNHAFSNSEKKFLSKIQNTNSVCVTIRLGDYINNSTHQVCTRSFYERAMDKMREMYPDCTFFIFSDEIKRAKEIFDFKYPVIYDSGEMKDYVSLNVMSNCKHFIISNSSFSWWAQYLSEYDRKSVIAPDRWYAKDVPCDIYEKDWILLKA